MDPNERLALVYPADVLKRIGEFVRTARQREWLQLDGLDGYLKERQRLISFPKNLSEDRSPVKRIRH